MTLDLGIDCHSYDAGHSEIPSRQAESVEEFGTTVVAYTHLEQVRLLVRLESKIGGLSSLASDTLDSGTVVDILEPGGTDYGEDWHTYTGWDFATVADRSADQ